VQRLHSATCATKLTINNCVTVVGYRPRTVSVLVKKGGIVRLEVRRQQDVLVVYGIFSASYKPSAVTYNIQAEDIDSILKCGRSIHGEAFLSGKRLPGGKFRGALRGEERMHTEGGAEYVLPGVTDADEAVPLFPEYKRSAEITDGAPTQFDNKTNYHQAAVWELKTGIERKGVQLITMHGKGVCDGYSNSPAKALSLAAAAGKIVGQDGPRDVVLYLACDRPTPQTLKTGVSGYWKADKIIYIYYDERLFTKTSVPDAKPMPGSSKVHMATAKKTADRAAALRDGPLLTSAYFCGCAACTAFNFDGCVMKDAFGSVVPKNCARASNVGLASQTMQLEDFARTLERDRVVALRVSADEADIEGALWFAILDDTPIKLTEATMHAGQEFGEGWLVANGHWFSLQGTPAANGDRTYAILPEVVMLNVNSMLPVATPIIFNAANKNARPRRARGGGFNSTTTYLLTNSVWESLTGLL